MTLICQEAFPSVPESPCARCIGKEVKPYSIAQETGLIFKQGQNLSEVIRVMSIDTVI